MATPTPQLKPTNSVSYEKLYNRLWIWSVVLKCEQLGSVSSNKTDHLHNLLYLLWWEPPDKYGIVVFMTMDVYTYVLVYDILLQYYQFVGLYNFSLSLFMCARARVCVDVCVWMWLLFS